MIYLYTQASDNFIKSCSVVVSKNFVFLLYISFFLFFFIL